jgi:hypothetical protein
MISDVLAQAIDDVNRWRSRGPEAYFQHDLEIDNVVAAMRGLMVLLDCAPSSALDFNHFKNAIKTQLRELRGKTIERKIAALRKYVAQKQLEAGLEHEGGQQ